MTLTLLFTLGEEVYGLEVDAIQEIVEDPSLHFVPRAEGILTGAINFHNQILAEIDLPGLLGYLDEKSDHRRIVLTPAYNSLALMVGGIQRIVTLDLSLLQPPPPDVADRAVRGMVDFEESEVCMLDMDEVINKLKNLYGG